MKSLKIVNAVQKMLLLAALIAVLPAVVQASDADIPLDKAPINLNNQESLQRGARLFVNYCLNCHSANYMRYNRLADIGLTDEQIKNNLLFTGGKVGDTMAIAMPHADAKLWFGKAPPDLTVEARARTADWLYTYLRGFTVTTAAPPAGTMWPFPMSVCRTSCGNCRGSRRLRRVNVLTPKGSRR